jgi:hypothetical protein
MTEQQQQEPDHILGGLWSGEKTPWCAKCGHHLNCHETGRVPLCDYDASGSNIDENGNSLEKGRIECNCDGFVGVKE